MLKIRALNREASSDEDTPVIRREAQEEIALELYNNALRLQAQEVFSEAESILIKLIDENIPLLENNGGLPKSMSNLKYSCHINIGNIYLKLNRINDALERFLLASELDATDVTLWYKIGNLSFSEDKFRQSVFAFAKGLECSESHWPCLDKLISVLFAIKDTVTCLEYIGKALTLDPDYTKGLVLRKQIYRDNPATKEYYKLYNPDSIWEPPLDISIAEEDEKTYLEEAQILVNKVNDAEKALAPKPLQTVALPKPLTDYTWLCLAETIVYIHQYLTDEGLSHFTMFDMSKSMSYTEQSTFKFPQSEVVETKTVDGKASDNTKIPQVNGETITSEDKISAEQIIERRASQNSDAMEVQESTPVQTDNDEEQNMEQENEDQDETTEPKERGRPRGSKRKRDLLSDLQTWGWYSRRKLSKKAKEKDFTVEDAFERIIPKTLLSQRIDPDKFNNFEDSMNTMDLYNLYVENYNVNYLSPIHSPKSVNYEQYFGTEKERDDVQEFWTKTREYIDAVVLIKDLVFHLSKLWHYKWPKELVPLYIKAYNMFREHCDPPQVFCGGHTFEVLRNDALASILFGELSVFSSEIQEIIPPTLIGYMRLISGWEDKWEDQYPSFFIRVFWLQAHLFRKENNNDLAINSLHLIQEAIEEEESKRNEKYMLSLPNCFKYGLVNIEITIKILKHLDVINSLGTVEHLYNSEKYRDVADILKATFNGGPSPQVGRMGRPAQLGILMHSLWYTDKTQCFVWTEECLNEAFEQYLKFSKDQDKWEKLLEKCLAILYEIVKSDTICVIDYLDEKNRARIVENLAKIVSKQLNSEGIRNHVICLKPWILLHFVLLREEQREYAKKRISKGKRAKTDASTDNEEPPDNTLPPSAAILFSAHEFLGPKGWCMANQGEILHFIIDTVLDKLDTPIFERMRDKIDIHIEQSMFCLYQHPSKKNKISRHLADHNVDPIPLSWERASQLFEFYGPDSLPEFNSYKNVSISADLEQLFKRIIALVPSNNGLQQHLPKIMDYIHGKTDKIMEPIEFPRKVKAIYYLIGDFYFKQKEFSKCIKYFQMDLCINPIRLDSWACLGLSYAAQLDTKLNHCEKFKSETEFLDKAKFATICFKKALEICPDPLMLWIEYGTFQYTVHSYCSRIMKFESENLSMEKFEFLENQKNNYLDSSGNGFEQAIAIYEVEETNEADERWLQYYILGKIAEKKQKEPTEYLQYYLTASTLLEENNAEYPEKINYNNPQHLSVEALELHYRIHASVLKYLELHEGKDIPNNLGAFFKKCLSASRFLKKPAAPPLPPSLAPAVPQQVPAPVIEPVPAAFPQAVPDPVPSVGPEDPDLLNKVSNSSSNFQEQFLNSLTKSGAPDAKESKTDEAPIIKNEDLSAGNSNTKTEPTPSEAEVVGQKNDCDIEDIIVLSDSDDDIKMLEPSEKEKTIITENTDATMETEAEVKNVIMKEGNSNTNEITTKTEEMDIDEHIHTNIKEVNDSNDENTDHFKVNGEEIKIKDESEKETEMDSHDPKTEDVKNETKVEESTKSSETDVEITDVPKESIIEVDSNGSISSNKIKDVQKVLDEMMMETMKETEEFRSEADSDLSGTEKVEVVVVKDDQECEELKVKMEEELEGVPKKNKSCDGEIDTDIKRTSAEESSSGSSSSSSSSESSDTDSDDDDDSSSSSSASSSDGTNEFLSHTEISHLIEKCVFGLEICITRLTQNYKALYRLAHVYFNYKAKKDLTKCKQLLLSEYKCKDGTVVSGLFNDRKPNNFFNGIWRIPSTEIDRPGSLSAHMSRCLSLLMQILRTTNDTKTLIDLCVHLRKTPEPDKIYIKDSERMAFSEQALTMCVQSIRGQLKHISNMTNPQIAKLLQEIYKIYQRLQKHVPGKESPFANLLEEVYRKFIKEKIPENINVLDLAIKFCSQNRAAEKQKLQLISKPPTLAPRGAGISSSAPVMPSPQSIIPPQSLLLKRPGTTRPRGRPPLQKAPGQPRYQRSKSPSPAGLSKSYPWQKSLMDHSYAYEYLKHYQDELIKQYSQNLSIAQLTQLSTILTQGQINNPLTANAITSQMLAQTGLLNSNLLKQINSAGNISQNVPSQLMDSLNQLNPNVKKKLGVDQALSSLTSDQLKVLGTLIPKPGTSSQSKPSTSISHVSTSVSGIITSKHGKQQTSNQRHSVPSTSKSVVVDHSKNKTAIATSVISSSLTNLPSGAQIFKEPIVNKVSVQEDKTAKDLMKDRPNISITPVAVTLPPPPSVSPNFLRPTSTSPSSGKTLQEKLAEKKKEQQTKQMKSTNGEDKRQADAFMKSFNIPSMPASLTVSPAHPSPVSTSEVTTSMFPFPKSTPSTKFPMDISMQPCSSLKIPKEQSLPASLTVSKATPSFPVDSGMSISQVLANQSKTSKEKSPPNKDSKQINPGGASVVLVPIKNKTSDKVKSKKTKSDNATKAVQIRQKLPHNSSSEISIDSVKQVTSKQSEDALKKFAVSNYSKHSEHYKPKKVDSSSKSELYKKLVIYKSQSEPTSKSDLYKKLISSKPESETSSKSELDKKLISSKSVSEHSSKSDFYKKLISSKPESETSSKSDLDKKLISSKSVSEHSSKSDLYKKLISSKPESETSSKSELDKKLISSKSGSEPSSKSHLYKKPISSKSSKSEPSSKSDLYKKLILANSESSKKLEALSKCGISIQSIPKAGTSGKTHSTVKSENYKDFKRPIKSELSSSSKPKSDIIVKREFVEIRKTEKVTPLSKGSHKSSDEDEVICID